MKRSVKCLVNMDNGCRLVELAVVKSLSTRVGLSTRQTPGRPSYTPQLLAVVYMAPARLDLPAAAAHSSDRLGYSCAPFN